MKLKPVQRTSLVDEVTDNLRQWIDNGGLKRGDRLPSEPELVAQLNVSRTVLREAIIRLQTVGLITIKRGMGMYVADQTDFAACARLMRTSMDLSSEELIRFVEVRDAIESYAARAAANLATEEDVAELETLCGELENSRDNLDEAIQIDLRFHLRIIDITGNQLMRELLTVLREFIFEGILRTTPKPLPQMLSRRCHMAIVNALRNHDAEAAEAAMHSHMHLLTRRLQEDGKRRRKTEAAK